MDVCLIFFSIILAFPHYSLPPAQADVRREAILIVPLHILRIKKRGLGKLRKPNFPIPLSAFC